MPPAAAGAAPPGAGRRCPLRQGWKSAPAQGDRRIGAIVFANENSSRLRDGGSGRPVRKESESSAGPEERWLSVSRRRSRTIHFGRTSGGCAVRIPPCFWRLCAARGAGCADIGTTAALTKAAAWSAGISRPMPVCWQRPSPGSCPEGESGPPFMDFVRWLFP